MKIGFIGAGKVGFTLGKYMAEHDVHVSGYYSKNLESAKEASTFTGSKFYSNLEGIISESDSIFLTVPDGSIKQVWEEILSLSKKGRVNLEGKMICHCSGALSSKVFEEIGEVGAIGYSIHPLFAICDKYKSYQNLSKAYFTIEYFNDNARENVDIYKELFMSMGNKVSIITADNKVKYHASAVFASNLVVGLYGAAAEMLVSCGFDEEASKEALLPLFLNNCENIGEAGVVNALTGPIERADVNTVKKHLEVLDEEEKEIYKHLSKQVVKIAKCKNQTRDYSEIENVL